MGRAITASDAAAQGEVIYQTGWPRRWGLVRMLCTILWLAAVLAAFWINPRTTSVTTQTKLLFTLVAVPGAIFALLGDDVVAITRTAVRRRSYLSTLLRRGFRTVELAPGSWFVRSRFSDRAVLWVGARPHSSPKQDVLTMRLQFEDDPNALMTALATVGVDIADERADLIARHPTLVRLESLCAAAYAVSLAVSFAIFPYEAMAGIGILTLCALGFVYWKAR